MRRFYFCQMTFIYIVTMAAAAHATPAMSLYISSQNQGFYYASATAFLVPEDFTVPFTTGRISTPDNLYVLTFDEFWKNQNPLPTFSSPAELIAAINQPWQILLDQGLPTERSYSTSLNVTGLQSTNISPPQITYPPGQSTVSSLTPTFTFTNLSDGSGMRLELINSGDTPVALETLSGATANWTPTTPLFPGEYYLNISRSLLIPDLVFATPLDALGEGISGWSSQSLVRLESSRVFTIIPEPTSALLAAAAGFGLFVICRRRKA